MCLKIESEDSGLETREESEWGRGEGGWPSIDGLFINLEDYYSFLFLLPKALPVNCVPVPCLFFDICKIRNVLTGRADLLSFPAR